jgi:predicted ferric reductase
LWTDYDYPVWQQIVPNRQCWTWTWTEETAEDIQPNCHHVFANWTGIVAAVFFIALWGSSLNWVRRRNYRLFYILHVTFGTLTLLGTILHMHWFVIYMIPSATYYLASTAPTLIQALASRFRGGVKIRQVVLVENSGGCVEVHLDAHKNAGAVLDREPCHFIKICVPKISLIWHPFDVYKSYLSQGDEADCTVRFIFRPVGPFTKQLAEHLTSVDVRPVTLVDGFYQGADKRELALQHDCVTLVAGGVAISHFLSLLPALLSDILERGNVKTKTVVLHWVVREQGLCSFVVKTYIDPILERASSLELDVKLAIHVYVTRGRKVDVSSSAMDTLEGSSRMMNSTTLNGSESEKLDTESAGSDQKETPSDSQGYRIFTGDDSVGHSLELARMMPGRYSNPIWNVPFFVAYTGASFLGFWYLFSQDPHDAMNYFDLSKMTWITLYALLMYIAFGVFVEATVLGLRSYWPQPKADEFDVAFCTFDKSNDVVAKADDDTSKGATISFRQGRPTVDKLFEEARKSTEPGIFMCGPSSLTSMVKTEASKENSYLGLTRFCLYEEPFEM